MNGKFGWMVLLVAAGAADAATFTVSNANDTGAGSLRQAITSANATTTPDIITFNVSQAGVVQISLQSGLPAISQPLVIDGLSQSGGSGPPLVRIDGASAGAGVSGLALSAPNCTLLNCVIQGLQITGFSGSGISVQSNAWTIRLNYIGNDGSLARANAGSGVVVSGTGVAIGGPAVERNVISGNGANGILLSATAANIGIRGNYIGLTASGASALRLSVMFEISRVGTIPRRRAAVEALVDVECPGLAQPERTWLVELIVVLVSSAVGEAFRGYLDRSGDETADRVMFAIDALIAHARTLAKKKEKKR